MLNEPLHTDEVLANAVSQYYICTRLPLFFFLPQGVFTKYKLLYKSLNPKRKTFIVSVAVLVTVDKKGY